MPDPPADPPCGSPTPAVFDFADLARTGTPDRWLYPLSAIAIIGGGLGLNVVIVMVADLVFPQTRDLMARGVADWNTVDLGSALGAFALYMSTIIIFLPLTLLAVRLIHNRPWTGVFSGRVRFSWRLLVISLVVALAFNAVIIGVAQLAFPERYEIRTSALTSLAFVPLILLLASLQTTAEEVVFRGYLMQAVGHATRRVSLRLLIPATVFFVVHLGNPEATKGGVPALLNYGVISIYLGWLALRSNGLETAIGLHVGINIVAFSVFSTRDSLGFLPGFIYLPDPDYWASLIGVTIFCMLHWLIIRRVLRREKSAGVPPPIANPPRRA